MEQTPLEISLETALESKGLVFKPRRYKEDIQLHANVDEVFNSHEQLAKQKRWAQRRHELTKQQRAIRLKIN